MDNSKLLKVAAKHHYHNYYRKGVNVDLKQHLNLLISDAERLRMEPLVNAHGLTKSEFVRLAIHHFSDYLNK